MIKKIAQLSNQLRDEGLPVSIRSTYSATEVYMELGETDRDLLRTALRAIYVKDRYDIPKFNKIFEEIFKKEKEESDSDDLPDRSKAYRGTGPKSNKYIIFVFKFYKLIIRAIKKCVKPQHFFLKRRLGFTQ